MKPGRRSQSLGWIGDADFTASKRKRSNSVGRPQGGRVVFSMTGDAIHVWIKVLEADALPTEISLCIRRR